MNVSAEEKIPLGELLPQAEPMVLLTDYEPPAGADEVTSFVDITAESPFFETAADGVPGCVALEYMAQTMALLVGIVRRRRGLAPKLGFVLGSRRLEIGLAHFRRGERYRVTATCEYEDDEFGSFACAIADGGGRVVAKGSLTAFQPGGEFTPEKMKEYL